MPTAGADRIARGFLAPVGASGPVAYRVRPDRSGSPEADIFPVDSTAPTPQEREILSRLQRHVYDESDGASAVLYSPEDVIVYKLKNYLLGRIPKHLRDIGAIMSAKGDALDHEYISHWAGRVGAGDVWAEPWPPTTVPGLRRSPTPFPQACKTCQIFKT